MPLGDVDAVFAEEIFPQCVIKGPQVPGIYVTRNHRLCAYLIDVPLPSVRRSIGEREVPITRFKPESNP